MTIDQLLSFPKRWSSDSTEIINDQYQYFIDENHLNHSAQSLLTSQNNITSYIFTLRDQLKYYIAIGYFYASFSADFLIYAAMVMPTDHLFNNIIVTGLGLEILFLAMIIILILSKVSAKVSN